jgi:hypothetical protein
MKTHWMNCEHCGRSLHARRVTKYCGPLCVKAAGAVRNAAPQLVKALRMLDAAGALRCTTDASNPCWNGRPTDVPGKHWAGGSACAPCAARAALAAADATAEERDIGRQLCDDGSRAA